MVGVWLQACLVGCLVHVGHNGKPVQGNGRQGDDDQVQVQQEVEVQEEQVSS